MRFTEAFDTERSKSRGEFSRVLNNLSHDSMHLDEISATNKRVTSTVDNGVPDSFNFGSIHNAEGMEDRELTYKESA